MSSPQSWILDIAETPFSFVVKMGAPDGVEPKDLTLIFHTAHDFSSLDKIHHALQIGVKKCSRVPPPPDFNRCLFLPEIININAKPIYSINNGVLSLTLHKLLPGLDCVKKEDEDDEDNLEELVPGLYCVKKEGEELEK